MKLSRTHGLRRRLETLEVRTVPTLGLLSALTAGNDVGSTQARDVAVDAVGNSYLTGFFIGTVDLDPNGSLPGDADILTSLGGSDIFVAKYAPNNSLIWARRLGGADPQIGSALTDTGAALEVNAAGNVFVCGRFTGAAEFGPFNLTSAGIADGFAAKFDAGGAVVWAKRWGNAVDDESGKSIDFDSAGNVFVLGYRLHSLSLPDNGNGSDVLKFSSAGANVWTKALNTHDLPISGELAVNPAGDVLISGSFWGTIDFNPGSGTFNVSSGYWYGGYVLKLTSSGNFSWVSPFVGMGSGSAQGSASTQSLTLDNGGNVIVGGYYNKTVDFKPGTGIATLPSIGGAFITKLNSSGNLTWVRGIESSGSTFVYSLDVDAGNNVYASGSFYAPADFDPGSGVDSHTPAGANDAYVMKLTSTGNYAWAATFGTANSDIAWGVAVTAAGEVLLAGGYSAGTIDLDPDPDSTAEFTNTAFHDLFFLRLSQP